MESMTTLRLMVFWAKFAAILFTFPTAAQSFDPHQADLDTYLTTLSDNNKIMTAVYVTQHGVPRYEHYAGLASVEDNVPISAQTRFRIGSVSKTFTAVLIMQLIEKNKLSLDTKLSQFFPAIPNAAQINIKHLLSHRSGIFSYTDDPDYMNFMTTPQTEAQLVSRIRGYQPLFSPGSQHKYSNSNYALLGFIIESLYGKPLKEVIAKNIAQPLNLNSTYYGNSIEIEENEASSYRYNGHWVKQPETHMSVPHGAGAIVSSAKDTNRFFTALFEGKLISTDSLKAMMQLEDGYGLGMTAAPFGEKQFYGHFGGIDGFVSAAGYNTEDGLNITVLSNAVNYNFNDVLIAVLKTMYGLSIDIPDFSAKPIVLSEKFLSAFEGQFASTQVPIKIHFWVENGSLMSQAEGQGALPLTPYSETEFRFDPAGIVINFDEPNDASSHSNGFVLSQGGGKYEFKRQQ
ncbi:serine hydrolase domain-containing protein [Alteromonas sp. 14N.309.X.WAT.G.H12]|uniref:serine hydrolase domain-containing protein n=1 Tax=Alteromonas sp. 14N.309.X.WAT.G.H12 TaxID=3120824 RepID=UPI002FD0C82A